MPINLGTEIRNNLENSGAITNDTTLSGDLSGSLPGATVTGMHGQSFQSSGFADGFGYRYSGGSFTLQTILGESSTFGGDVSGTQASGLSVLRINNSPVEIISPVSGQILTYNGSNWANTAPSSGINKRTASANITAADGDRIECNSTSGVFTVTCPASPSANDAFRIIDNFGQFATNAVTIVPDSGTISGDTSIVADVNNLVIDLVYNGTEWRYYVISVRP